MSNAATRRRTVMRRPYRSLAVMIAVPAISMPVTLLASQAANAAPGVGATALEAAQPQAGVVLTITSMTPRQAGPGSTITVTGKLRNASQQQFSQLAVSLSSASSISSVTQIEAGASDPSVLAATPVPGASWQMTGQLKPGAVANWSIHVKARALSMTTFGVYPLVAQAQSTQAQSTQTGLPLAVATTYLPYTPAKKGQYGSSIPARTKISWVWPLIDKPLTAAGQSACHGPQAQALAASLVSTGRLGKLVAGAVNGGRAAITWAIDPALLGDVKALTACRSSQPKWATAASSWLKKVRELSSAQPVFVTPYGDSNVAALIGAQHAGDVEKAFAAGGSIGGRVLDRDLSAGSATSRPTAEGPTAEGKTASIAWPAGGIPGDSAGYSVLENLAADRVQTLLLPSSYLQGNRATVLRTPDNGGYMKLLLANDSLTRLLGTGGSTTGNSDFASAQEFLAATALLAEQHPGQPIVVAPPQRWDPAPGLAADMLAVTGSASWLSPVSLTSLTSGKKIPVLTPLPSEGRHRMLNGTQARVLRRVDGALAKLELLRAKKNPDDYLPMFAAESSAWQSTPKVALGALRALELRIRHQLSQGVKIESEQRFTLGGLKGSVPVSVDNTLNYAVAVRFLVNYNHSSGISIAVSPGGAVSPNGLVTIGAHTVVTARLRVQATQVGATTVTLSLADSKGLALPGDSGQRMTIQATQVGVLGVIIFAVALGIFLIATAARAARRGRQAPAAEQSTDHGLSAQHAADSAATPPEPDTVMAERTELGAAGAPGRD